MSFPARLALLVSVAFLIWGGLESSAAEPAVAWPFFAMDNGVGRGVLSPPQQAELLTALGYDGISYNYTNNDELQQRLATFRKTTRKVVAVYFPTDLDQPELYDSQLRQAVPMLRGTGAVLWLLIKGGQYGAEDDRVVRLAQEVADLAQASELRVAIYPHLPDYIKTTEDALRIVARAQRTNLGVSMNLAHEWLAGRGDRIPETLRTAAPHLFLVTINGADRKPAEGAKSILRLGQGEFDILAVLRTLREINYRGPVGLQCTGIGGEVRENLQEAMRVWKEYQAALAENK